jgi:hypothetical protein
MDKKTKLEEKKTSKILWTKQTSFVAPCPLALEQF